MPRIIKKCVQDSGYISLYKERFNLLAISFIISPLNFKVRYRTLIIIRVRTLVKTSYSCL